MWSSCSGRTTSRRPRGSSIAPNGSAGAAPRSAAGCRLSETTSRLRWSFPIVGVAAARVDDERRIVLAGVAPVPWVLDSPEALADATPLPGTAYKVEIAEALVRRALEAVA